MIFLGAFGKQMIKHPLYFLAGLMGLSIILSIISWVRGRANPSNER